MKRALVLSGGGAKGAFQVGALDYLVNEKKYDFDVICGVSVGALNAAMIAQDDFGLLKYIWLGIESSEDVYRHRWGRVGKWLGAVFGSTSLYSNAPLAALINKYVDQKKIISTGKELRIGVVSLTDGEYTSATQSHSDLKKIVLASTTIPIAFAPINISANLMSMVDGGVRNITPLKEAIDIGAQEIVVILCSPKDVEPGKRVYRNVLDIGLRTLDIVLNEVFLNDIEVCRLINEKLKDTSPYRYIDLKIIMPEKNVIDTLDFDPIKIRSAMEVGRRQALSVVG